MSNEWKLPSEKKDVLFDKAKQAESDLRDALDLLDRNSQSMTISAMESFNIECKNFLNKFRKHG